MMFRVVIGLTLLCLVYGQRKYCCFPAQWEGEQGSTTGSADDEGHTALNVGNAQVSYDLPGQRFLLDQKLENGNETRQYQILQLYGQNVEYITENGQCTRVALKKYDPDTSCIPNNATVAGRYMLGRKQNMMVTEYMWNVGQVTVMLAVNDECVPVVSKSFGNVNGDDILQGMGYLGITGGIKDPAVFDIPSICNHATERETSSDFAGPLFLTPIKK